MIICVADKTTLAMMARHCKRRLTLIMLIDKDDLLSRLQVQCKQVCAWGVIASCLFWPAGTGRWVTWWTNTCYSADRSKSLPDWPSYSTRLRLMTITQRRRPRFMRRPVRVQRDWWLCYSKADDQSMVDVILQQIIVERQGLTITGLWHCHLVADTLILVWSKKPYFLLQNYLGILFCEKIK